MDTDLAGRHPQRGRLALRAGLERWRTLFRAAQAQRITQNASSETRHAPSGQGPGAPAPGRGRAQLSLLTNDRGPLPVRLLLLPLFRLRGIPARLQLPPATALGLHPGPPAPRGGHNDDFLSRPRFLAISEFGPRSFVYHEGSRYIINRVILPIGQTEDGTDQPVRTSRAKQCPACGYMHPLEGGALVDQCMFCGTTLGAP